MILIHHLNNSRSQRILWLLEEIGADYEIRHYQRDAKTNLAPPELLEVHPLGKSPVIEVDGQLLAESGAITEYLCSKFAPEMIPEPDTRAHIEHMELMHFAEGSAMTPILLDLYVGRLGEAGAPLHPRIQQQLTSHFDFMEQALRPSGHFVLDTLSAVDIMVSFPAEVAHLQGQTKHRPKLKAYVEMIQSRPAYKRALEKGGPYRFA
ncbi:MAG: glutathione S-transferase [Pseudomonadota bacterium]